MCQIVNFMHIEEVHCAYLLDIDQHMSRILHKSDDVVRITSSMHNEWTRERIQITTE